MTEQSEAQVKMSREDATSLDYIRRIWGDRYRIDFYDKLWRASRLGGPVYGNSWYTAITADSAETLRNLIGEDYRLWQIESRKVR
jgi:hypothetical protein